MPAEAAAAGVAEPYAIEGAGLLVGSLAAAGWATVDAQTIKILTGIADADGAVEEEVSAPCHFAFAGAASAAGRVSGSVNYLLRLRVSTKGGSTAEAQVYSPVFAEGGEAVPDLHLINQDGKQVSLSDFKGKAVLVTFIYTRCPMPAFCPRLSSQFSKIHEALAKTSDDYEKTHLLTISFDPKYDTPPVLRKYGLAYLDNHAEGFAHWDFASAEPGEMRNIADAFGLEYFEEDNQISHSMDIVLIAPGGTVARYWATEWTTAELEEALRRAAKPAPVDTSTGRPGVKR